MNEFDTAMQELSKALKILEGQTLSQAMSEVNKDPLARADINAIDQAADKNDTSTGHHTQSLTPQAPSQGPSFFTRVKAENHVITDRQRDLGYKPRNPVLREVWASGI